MFFDYYYFLDKLEFQEAPDTDEEDEENDMEGIKFDAGEEDEGMPFSHYMFSA